MALPKDWVNLPRGVLKIHLPARGMFPCLDVELYPMSEKGNSPGYIPYVGGVLMGIGVVITRKELMKRLKSRMYILVL